MPSGDSILSLDEGAPLATETPGHPEARIDSAARALFEDRGLLALASEHDGPVFVCERASSRRPVCHSWQTHLP